MSRLIPIGQIEGYNLVHLRAFYCFRDNRRAVDAVSDNLERSGLEILASDDPIVINVTKVEEQHRLQIRAHIGKILGLKNPHNSSIIAETNPDSVVLNVPAKDSHLPIEIFYNP